MLLTSASPHDDERRVSRERVRIKVECVPKSHTSAVFSGDLLQALEAELRTMCGELKKKHTTIREVSERARVCECARDV